MLQRLRAAGVFRSAGCRDALRPWFDPVIGKFARFLAGASFDILHAHGAKAGLITRLALNWRSRLAYPVIVSCHNGSCRIAAIPATGGPLAGGEVQPDTSHFIAVSPASKMNSLE